MKYRETTITQPSKVIEAKLLYQYIVIFEKYKSNKISLEKKNIYREELSLCTSFFFFFKEVPSRENKIK